MTARSSLTPRFFIIADKNARIELSVPVAGNCNVQHEFDDGRGRSKVSSGCNGGGDGDATGGQSSVMSGCKCGGGGDATGGQSSVMSGCKCGGGGDATGGQSRVVSGCKGGGTEPPSRSEADENMLAHGIKSRSLFFRA
jgi:hypothetical protein